MAPHLPAERPGRIQARQSVHLAQPVRFPNRAANPAHFRPQAVGLRRVVRLAVSRASGSTNHQIRQVLQVAPVAAWEWVA